jgi:hypothetical protein
LWRLMFLLSLIAALSGTPLRQAEAADDLARSIAGLGGGHTIEVVDGGVGDDSGATIKAGGDTDDSSPSLLTDGLSLPLLPGPAPSRPHRLRREDRPSRLPASSGRRHALLQRYLF